MARTHGEQALGCSVELTQAQITIQQQHRGGDQIESIGLHAGLRVDIRA